MLASALTENRLNQFDNSHIGKNEKALKTEAEMICEFILHNAHNEKPKESVKLCQENDYNADFLGRITTLDLSRRNLKELPTEIKLLKNLKILCLTTNQLSDLPDELKYLTDLTILELQGNDFISLPPVLQSIESLRQVHLANNKIESLPISCKSFIAYPLPNFVRWT